MKRATAAWRSGTRLHLRGGRVAAYGSTTNRAYATDTSKVKVYVTSTTDPLFNIATEEWIFREGDPTKQTLYLWRNAPTVVIGRHQNPFKECHLSVMERENVVLARRYSGGGAVYQDLGNTNFTFLSNVGAFDKVRNSGILINALKKRFNITASASGRNDILVDGKKISGSAYKISNGRALHHGTMLINVDFASLGKILNPDKAKLKSKGVDSVQARVQNLKDLNPEVDHESMCDALVEEFYKTYEDRCEIEYLKHEMLASIPSLANTYATLQDWKWRFGETPAFEHSLEKRFTWGNIDLLINAKNGRITEVKIFSDSLYPQMIDDLTLALHGRTYDKQGVTEAIEATQSKMKEVDNVEANLEELKEWLVHAM
ncbi:lipoyltransferase and lipoateprotein ligase [Acanthamoeba castellanii str. Neff]|uniref:lipoate--protein ligase n=1 Tax=Acanthamoeba castellanii (strain ATCC 30010 / Neff) TaxID=1257118 RepID=L8H6V8_ACACF|nr:lipoyltransferase and lipoateprotein ligase [Acanthamoeba castellanii str. Neff]ELR20191.1 lipoyltransferase and lipoateprotein ligase [Acanthamoeba castellanii str. Neff]